MSRFHDGFYASDDCAWQNGSWYVVLHYCSKFFSPPPVIKINQSLNWLGVRYKYLFSRPSIRFNGTVAWLWTFLSMTTIQEIISVKDGDEFPPQSISHLLLRPMQLTPGGWKDKWCFTMKILVRWPSGKICFQIIPCSCFKNTNSDSNLKTWV